jgi:hypothetical protein
MLLDKQGKVSEAGGGLYQDSQPFNMARGAQAISLPMHHTRVVDYISAACVLIPRSVFLSLSLFDETYRPAYYEDTDAAVKMARAGYATVLMPLSIVMHFESSSYGQAGKETEKPAQSNVTVLSKDALLQANAIRFAQTHGKWLQTYCPQPLWSSPSPSLSKIAGLSVRPMPNDPQVHMSYTFMRQTNRRPHVLFLDDIVPEPDRDAGK